MTTNFRSVTRAHKNGWHLIEMGAGDRNKHPISHFSLCTWIDKNTMGKYISNYDQGYLSRFAFERAEDAMFFKLKWA